MSDSSHLAALIERHAAKIAALEEKIAGIGHNNGGPPLDETDELPTSRSAAGERHVHRDLPQACGGVRRGRISAAREDALRHDCRFFDRSPGAHFWRLPPRDAA
jgi:hypothetical protein